MANEKFEMINGKCFHPSAFILRLRWLPFAFLAFLLLRISLARPGLWRWLRFCLWRGWFGLCRTIAGFRFGRRRHSHLFHFRFGNRGGKRVLVLPILFGFRRKFSALGSELALSLTE